MYFYLDRQSRPQGPVSRKALEHRVEANELPREVYVRRFSEFSWRTFGQELELLKQSEDFVPLQER